MRIDRLKKEFDIDVRVVPFPLHSETPDAGLTLEELFKGRNIDLDASHKRMAGLMAEEGLPYGKRTMTYNSRLAQELALWAATQPNGEKIHRAIFEAYFVEGVNIAIPETLMKIVEEIGLPVDEAQDVLKNRTYRSKLDVEWQRCRQMGLSGVPGFLAGERGVMGAQPYEVLKQLLVDVGAVKRIE